MILIIRIKLSLLRWMSWVPSYAHLARCKPHRDE